MYIMSLVQVESGTFARSTWGGCYPADKILTDLLKSLACLLLPQELRLVCFSTLHPWYTCSAEWCRNDPFAWRHHLPCSTIRTVQWSNFVVQMSQSMTPTIAWKFCPHSSPLFILHKVGTYRFINLFFFLLEKEDKKYYPLSWQPI